MNKALLTSLALAGAVTFAQAQQVKGDARAAEAKVAQCVGCHGIPGYQSSFPEVHKVPMIAGQGAAYIAAALNAYRKGDRKHPTMRGIAVSLTDQDIADISAYYAQLGGNDGQAAPPEQPAVQPSAEVAALLAKGACISCHGANFNKPIDPAYPKIAGQHADYLNAALRAYKTEKNPNVGRNNAIMSGQVKQFSTAELKAMAQYIGSLPGELRTVKESAFK